MLHMQHHILCNISYVVIAESMGKSLKYTTIPYYTFYVDLHTSPSNLHIRTIDFISRRLTFVWSPVTPDCPGIHYNILASNCGSCPTTTNHTTVTCTDIPTSHSMCIFAIQPVLCGNLIGNSSVPIRVNITTSLDRNNADTCTNTAYIIATSSLAVGLITSVVVFITTIVIILRKRKAKIKELQLLIGGGRSIHMEPMYEDVTGPSPSVSAINIQDNVAYGHTKTPALKESRQ